MVWIQIRTNIFSLLSVLIWTKMSFLIWVQTFWDQTVCKGHQQKLIQHNVCTSPQNTWTILRETTLKYPFQTGTKVLHEIEWEQGSRFCRIFLNPKSANHDCSSLGHPSQFSTKIRYDITWESFSWNIMPYLLFWKSGKIWNCRLLQFMGGPLRVK